MIKACVIGASGYTGAELCRLLETHPEFHLAATYVSSNSADGNKPLNQLYPHLTGVVSQQLIPLQQDRLTSLAMEHDVIFLATPHEASHDWIPALAGHRAVILDLSGAYRIKDRQVFSSFYGFEHQQPEWLEQAVYGLAEWYPQAIAKAALIAVPGCYPTASLTALKPLQQAELIDPVVLPIINAVSGVSGAGRKAALTSSFCEVSLQAYGVLGHRHQPEISAFLGQQVVFTPHLGNFKRGILATIAVKTKPGTQLKEVNDAFSHAYKDSAIVRLLNGFPKLDDVVNTPYCDLHWKLDEASGYMIVGSAIDNLLKGAASQAIQCANLRFDMASETGLTGKSWS